MRVVDPLGTRWHVSCRWLPWRRRTAFDDFGVGAPEPSGDNEIVSLLIGIAWLVVVAPVVVLGFVVALELLLLLLLVPAAVLARVMLGRRWRVKVRRERSYVWEDEVGTSPRADG